MRLMIKKTLNWGCPRRCSSAPGRGGLDPRTRHRTRAGTTISNSATVNFQDVNRQPAGGDVAAGRDDRAPVWPERWWTRPTPRRSLRGVTFYYSHTVTNTGKLRRTRSTSPPPARRPGPCNDLPRHTGVVGTYEPASTFS
jgi:hypothetical protein